MLRAVEAAGVADSVDTPVVGLPVEESVPVSLAMPVVAQGESVDVGEAR